MAFKKRTSDKKWDRIASSGAPCSLPNYELTELIIRKDLDPENLLGDLKAKKVLCLASGGGQQSVGFGMLGAEVTVVDISANQLKLDEDAAKRLALNVKTLKTDMRDLSALESDYFDVVYQPYSINYVRSVDGVFDEVSRVLKKQGVYYLSFHNPFVHGSWKDGMKGSRWRKKELWRGVGYPIKTEYKEGVLIKTDDPHWNFVDIKGFAKKVRAPQEYKHTLSSIFNGLLARGFKIVKVSEYTDGNIESEPGTWDHYVACATPWLFVWAKKENA